MVEDALSRRLLRDELFLLGHYDDTGLPITNRRTLSLGVAGASLIDLFLAERIALVKHGRSDHALDRTVQARTGQPLGDTLADSVATDIRRAEPTSLHIWLKKLSEDMYERALSSLIAAGVMRRVRIRRLAGLVQIDAHLATDSRRAVAARSCLRYLAAGNDHPNNHSAALAGLIVALQLTDALHLGSDPERVSHRLSAIARQHFKAIQYITAGVAELARMTR
ncbi:GPP34 family phosphoprotein [Micromonospora mangrovi]|uniref:GPP34 family phosphoprotein n=2 Tax=Micromonospora TaxID=1873 RepID=A0AAU8HFQ4_9ACTN